jgi:hypothetical protein
LDTSYTSTERGPEQMITASEKEEGAATLVDSGHGDGEKEQWHVVREQEREQEPSDDRARCGVVFGRWYAAARW